MNKADYKRTFSAVHPCEEAMERIFTLTERKPQKIRWKGLLAAVAVVTILLCGTLSANAATDGKLFKSVEAIANADEVKLAEKANDDEPFFNRIKVVVNGEEMRLNEYFATQYKDGDVINVDIAAPDGDKLAKVAYFGAKPRRLKSTS